MARVKLNKGQQEEFLNCVAKHFNFNWVRIARMSNVCERTLRDWRQGKYNMSYEALQVLHRISRISIPKIIGILPEHWSLKKASRAGAIKRNELYGNPGTPESRRKGGIISQRKFQMNPDYANRLGFKVRKTIKHAKKSPSLAEFVGIVLGDGNISDYQIKITFNRDTDKEHADFIQKTIKDLFNISSVVTANKDLDKGEDIVISSRDLVELLEKLAFQAGNKVKNQVDIPDWILKKESYRIACLRGLVDTDGSFYLYRHRVFNKEYCNFAMCFTNHSKPLLTSVYRVLKDLDFNPAMNTKRIYLHKKQEIDRYFKEIGTHNPKHLKKYINYIDIRNLRRGTEVVITGRSRKAVGP